jgi:hypothetical protein
MTEPQAAGSTDTSGFTDSTAQPVPRWRRGRCLADGSRLIWWRELLLVGAIYVVYEAIRNVSAGDPGDAFANALRIIDWQEALGIYHEKAVQEWALHFEPLIVVSNIFYGTAYIIATLGVLVWLYRKVPDDYPLWRNTLAIGTLLGLVGFAWFPLMPPRLLDVMGDGRPFGFVDTLVHYPTLWSFESGTMQKISNQFAAMPSLHCGWAFWGAAAMWPRVRTPWMKAVAIFYPTATVFVVVATGNHFFLDAVGGAVIFVLGYGIARVVTRAGRRAPRPAPEIAES